MERTGATSGANSCRNQAIRASSADLIVFLDSDDVLERNCLARRIAVMARNLDLDFATFQTGVFTNAPGDLGRQYNPELIGDDLHRFLSFDLPWIITAPVWRRAALVKLGMFDENVPSWQDVHLHVRAIAAKMRYLRFAEIDNHVRWQRDATKTSVRHFFEPAYIEAAEGTRNGLFDTVKNAGLLTWSRQRALLGLAFGLAESWLRAERVDRAMRAWRKACQRDSAPITVWVFGLAMLRLLRLSRGDAGLISRLVNKWKGWMRFRQEPRLMMAVDDSVLELPVSRELTVENSNPQHTRL
jgi:glycosyltransferase involved in cell wall biosynthesis